VVEQDHATAPASQGGFVRRTLSSFRSRNFRLFFIGQTISNTGNWLTMVALALLVLHRTGSGVAVGLLSACQFGPILLLSAWAGVVVDRHNKRNLLVVTQTLEMCQSFALAALAFMHDATRRVLHHRCARRLHVGVRQPGAADLRQRDGAHRRRTERGDAL
jgi:hypothetical protein